MPAIHFSGGVPSAMSEATRPGRWAAGLQMSGDPSLVAFVDLVGSADLYLDSSFDATTGTVLLWNIAAPDYEGFARAGLNPVLNFSLRVFLKDGTRATSDTSWNFAVTDVDDTPPTALAFDSGGMVVPGQIGATIGHLRVTDLDSTGPYTYRIGDADAWMYEVVNDTLKLRDGMAVAISDGPYRIINIEVSDGHQSAAFALPIRVESPAPEQAVLDVLDTWESKSGFHYKNAGTVQADRGAWEVERIEYYGTALTDVLLKDGNHVWLQQVGRIEFLNGVIDMRPGSGAEIVTGLFQTVLGRNVDRGYLWDWAAAIDNGTLTRQTVATWLVDGPEFQARFPNMSNEAFVRMLYRNTEGGTPYEAGVQGWKSVLDHGMSRVDVALTFQAWEVAKTNLAAQNSHGYWMDRPFAAQVSAIYDVALDRLPERDGFEYWMGNLSAGLLAPKDLAKLFGQSSEFLGRFAGMSQEQFVRELYLDALHREPDLDGFNYWVGHLRAGTLARSDMVESFGFSPEKLGGLLHLPMGEPFL